ncbi:choice-of-anchor B family protein [Salinibacter grassmerensis]|uniref:choice-of-anchor B family protein n=1 Tax=Salinibacter grassmerensis TaxID=3040353 RepID=UPI0021E713AB|nr:choice-of-anchor B family protein [Salinibacter grassmerensis]
MQFWPTEHPPFSFWTAALLGLAVLGVRPGLQAAQGQSSITGTKVVCTDGTAGPYPCADADLLSLLSIEALGGTADTELNDVWGWTDPQTGTEYALVGRTDGTAFVDVSTPTEPVYVGELPSHTTESTWRDVKVYDHHAFVVSEAPGHGMQVFDLTRLRDVGADERPRTFDETAHYDGGDSVRLETAHNVAVNPETGFAYIVGGDASGSGSTCGGGLHMVNVQSPAAPTFAGCFPDVAADAGGSGRPARFSEAASVTPPALDARRPRTSRAKDSGYTHDAQCVTYRGPDTEHRGDEICINANETVLNIADVTDKDAPVTIAETGYPDVGYVHQAWLTDDHRYLYVDDELDERNGLVDRTRTLVFDVTDLETPTHEATFVGSTGAIDHNQYLRGSYAYQANYASGLRVLDVAAPKNPEEVAYFDTYPDSNAPKFRGAWSTYPFFDRNMVLVSSIGQGLFVVQPQPAPFLSFTGTRQGRSVQLRWTTSAAAQTARTDVEHKTPEADTWERRRTIEGRTGAGPHEHDVSLDDLSPGTHQFRLRHIPADGPARTSRTKSVKILPSAAAMVSGPAPNPTRGQSVVQLTLRETQDLRVALHDEIGRRVRLLQDGRVEAGVIHRFRVRASRHAAGTYFLRIQGESVQVSRKVVVMR